MAGNKILGSNLDESSSRDDISIYSDKSDIKPRKNYGGEDSDSSGLNDDKSAVHSMAPSMVKKKKATNVEAKSRNGRK